MTDVVQLQNVSSIHIKLCWFFVYVHCASFMFTRVLCICSPWRSDDVWNHAFLLRIVLTFLRCRRKSNCCNCCTFLKRETMLFCFSWKVWICWCLKSMVVGCSGYPCSRYEGMTCDYNLIAVSFGMWCVLLFYNYDNKLDALIHGVGILITFRTPPSLNVEFVLPNFESGNSSSMHSFIVQAL